MKKIFLAFVLLLFAIPSYATNYYVKPSSSGGNGTSWTTAWNGFSGINWTVLTGGDTVWVAGGGYGYMEVQKGGTSVSSLLAFRRARSDSSACTGAAGWSSSYDSLITQTSMINIQSNSYLVFSGRTTAAGGTHGWKISYPTTTSATGIYFYNGVTSHDMLFEYIEIAGPGKYNVWGEDAFCAGVYLKPNNSATRDHTYSHMKIHGWADALIITGASYLTIEYSEFYDMGSGNPVDTHPDIIYIKDSNYGIFRYNTVHDNEAYGTGIAFSDSGYYNYWKVYGNVFYENDASGSYALAVQKGSGGGGSILGLEIYNNTWDDSPVRLSEMTCGAGCYEKNNVYIGNSGALNCGTTSNNITVGAGAFIDRAARNYRPVSNIGSGYMRDAGTTLTLDGYINKDLDGNTRGENGTWDAGAFEYGSGPSDNPMTVTAEADRATNTATETVTGTASDADGVAGAVWSNSRGGSGSCTGDTSWSCGSITMYNGVNIITVTVADDLNNTGTDTVTLTYYESVSNNTTIAITEPGLVYFKATGSGNFKLTGSVNASSGSYNSFFVDIGSDPGTNEAKGWHIDFPTTGYDDVDVRWGTWDNPDAYQSPTVWVLSGANQILYIREREPGTLIESVKFVSMSADSTAPSVTIATSSPQSITSDALTVTGTATDAVWGTGSVCKFRIGSEPTAVAGTACTGTTDWSCAATGFALGANTLYIECGDAVPNWSTGNSITVNYGNPTPLPAVTMRGASIAGGTFK